MPSASDLRTGIAELAAIANDDLDALWASVRTAVEAEQALHDLLPALVDVYGEAAAALAADWYDDLREANEIRGSFRAIAARTADRGEHALAGVATAPWRGVPSEDVDWSAVRSKLYGGLQMRIADVARDTITFSSIQDRGATGWQRVASGGCIFCQTLAGRGTVYTEKTADFASHDNCNCVATVAWKGLEVPVKPYVPSLRNSTDADKARVKAWMAANI
ncbi:hypothetical protein [Prescottella agglutinans]|uniref:Uncharacterized protein n=1 Tax=Prescottella agglutinans TaxID=1644129 RepID=A0ABT6MHE6_9NOCA|nr:hypothetical protein [Prescottella agglutinans]MDH6283221.1 hypothetical protein [Prescottella agglutinans]